MPSENMTIVAPEEVVHRPTIESERLRADASPAELKPAVARARISSLNIVIEEMR